MAIPGFTSSGNRCVADTRGGPPLAGFKTASGDVFESKPRTYFGVTISAPAPPASGG